MMRPVGQYEIIEMNGWPIRANWLIAALLKATPLTKTMTPRWNPDSNISLNAIKRLSNSVILAVWVKRWPWRATCYSLFASALLPSFIATEQILVLFLDKAPNWSLMDALRILTGCIKVGFMSQCLIRVPLSTNRTCCISISPVWLAACPNDPLLLDTLKTVSKHPLPTWQPPLFYIIWSFLQDPVPHPFPPLTSQVNIPELPPSLSKKVNNLGFDL